MSRTRFFTHFLPELVTLGLFLFFAPTLSAQNPVPSITRLSPAQKATGRLGFTLTITGANFIPTSSVNFGGTTKTPAFVSSSVLTVPILATDIDFDRSVSVEVI